MAIELTTTSEGILAEIRSTIGLGVEDTPTFYGVTATGPAGSEIAVIKAGLDDDHKYEFGQGSLGYRYQNEGRQKWSVNNESLVLGDDSLSNRVSFNKIGDGIASISTPDVSDVLTSRFVITKVGDIGIGTTTPTAKIHIAAGSATANTAPLKITAGTNLTTPEAGAIEYDGTNLYFTDSGGVRRTLAVVP